MTEKLKTLLHEQATIPDFVPVDLATVTASGERRVRRRRSVGAAGVLAAAAVVGTLAATGLGGDDGPRVATDLLPTDQVSWVEGTTLHTGDRDVELDGPVRAYVRTAAGFVLADADGRVWSVTTGLAREVGSVPAQALRLVGDADGSLAAWSEAGRDAAVVVLDLETGETTRLPQDGPVDVRAVDGRSVFWQDGDRAVVADVDSGHVEALSPDAGTVVAAEDGLVARDEDPDPDLGGSIVVQGPAGTVALSDVHGSSAAFSPDGAYLTVDSDEPAVYDVATGRRIAIDLGDRAFGSGYEWLDATSLVLIAARTETGPVELLVCRVPDGTCANAATFGTFDELMTDYALPFGEPFGA